MVLKGTPGATPSAPTLSRVAGGNWDIAVADVYVGAAVTEITDADITPNILDTDLCGIMTPRVTFDTTNITAQFNALLAILAYDIEQVAGGGVVAHGSTHAVGAADEIPPESIGAEKERLEFLDVAVSTSGWSTYTPSGTEETEIHDTLSYTYRKEISDLTGVTSGMRFGKVSPNAEYESCGTTIFRKAQTITDGLYLYAKAVPTAAFTVDIFIMKEVG